jgi:hypothetical protein
MRSLGRPQVSMRSRGLLLLTRLVSCGASMVQADPGNKFKVLCLHGYSQNPAAFRDRSGGFRKPLKKSSFVMHYAEGPFGCTAKGEDPEVADADMKKRAWWRGHSGMDQYDGWPTSHKMLTQLWREHEFDGILGFSQGAAAAAMLSAEVKPKFAIFVSGFVPRDGGAAASLLAGVSDVPSLHVFGSADELVVPERSRALSELFEGASTLEHPGGHMTPSGAAVRAQFNEFLIANALVLVPSDGSAAELKKKRRAGA